MTSLIQRTDDLAVLRRWRDQPLIKVVTGVRRCGKSTLLRLFKDELLASGTPPNRIIEINLEDLETAASVPDFHALHSLVISRLSGDGTNYVFIDEVQAVEGFERAISSLHLRENIDLYVTGSNATLLSGELATLLSGRYIEVALTPLSFSEYLAGREAGNPNITLEAAYREFSSTGSFPYVPRLLSDPTAVRDYLDGILNTVLLKDVMTRQRVANPTMLRDVVGFLMSNVGSPISLRRIANTLESAGRKPSPNTIENYLTGLINAFVFYQLRPYDLKGLRHLDAPSKYYAVDAGLRAAVLGQRGGDVGHILENVVFHELNRRHRNLYLGRVGRTEVDFVGQDGADLAYYQVAATVRDETTLQRELAPLRTLDDNYPKFLLTLDQDPPVNHNGIRQVYMLDWLLGR